MRDKEYDRYLEESNIAESARGTYINALRRIERTYNCDLDDEFRRDKLVNLLNIFTYTHEDEVAGRPNPLPMNMDPNKTVRSYVGWYKRHLSRYAGFCSGSSVPESSEANRDGAEEAIQDAITQTFGLERDLQNALRNNLDQLESGLEVMDGGLERKVEAGFIDILARDRKGNIVVIELKAGDSKPEAIAQILSYMASLSETEKSPVRGYLIAASHPRRVELAAKLLPNLQLKTYRYRFQFD